MKKVILILILALVVIFGGMWAFSYMTTTHPVATNTPTPTLNNSDQTVSDGTITIAYPSATFALATTQQQILATSYIPPCSENFNYCLYYNGSAYRGTNFESAGIRVKKRTDLNVQQLCMNMPPSGYPLMTASGAGSGNGYVTSVFSPIGDAGAGHYATGALYRLYLQDPSTCYEFETRIGQTQFANYPAGSIKEFSATDQANVMAQLTAILNATTLKDATKISFPTASK